MMGKCDLSVLNENQREAATTINGPLLIIAGAGSGKTTVLINRVAYMIEQGIAPEKILLLTFTNKAADNMLNRARRLADDRCRYITACTYHSFCAKLLRKYHRYVGLPRDFEIMTPSHAVNALALVKARRHEYYNTHRRMPKNQLVLGILSKAINTERSIAMVISEDYQKYEAEIAITSELIAEYQSYKKEKNLLDYDDLLTKTQELLGIDSVRRQISAQYQYVMVDEYQDTNALQEDILFTLCKDHHNLAVVGDDYQSIYAFRGSDINNILQFEKKMANCKVVMIDTNYRSTKQILDLANCMMKEHATFGYPKTMKDNHAVGEKVFLERVEDSFEESDFIVEKIKGLLEKGVSPEEIAVLERNASASTRLEIALQNAKIPFRKLGGLKFMERECVQDMLSILRVLVNRNTDEISWFRVLDLIPGIGNAYANKLVGLITNDNFLVENDYKNHKFYSYLIETDRCLKMAEGAMTPEEQYDLMYEFYINIKTEKTKQAKFEDEAERTAQLDKIEDDKVILHQLRELVLEYKNLIDFLDSIALDANPNVDNTKDMVTISTIHSAKGLEWKVVFIMDCVESAFPKGYVDHDQKEYDEELRCMYVAITRAKEELHIMAPYEVMVYGAYEESGVSRFLIGCEDLMEEKDNLPEMIY